MAAKNSSREVVVSNLSMGMSELGSDGLRVTVNISLWGRVSSSVRSKDTATSFPKYHVAAKSITISFNHNNLYFFYEHNFFLGFF